MTLNAKIKVLCIFWQTRAARHISRGLAPKPVEIDRDKLRMEFSALNVDFDGSSIDFLGSRKPAHEGIKERYPRKTRDEMAGDRLTVCEQKLL